MTGASAESTVSVAIPTFEREGPLLDTIAALLAAEPPPDEILVIDQTAAHEADTTDRLQAWHDGGDIRWLRLDHPSIPASMNMALCEARSEIVLFVDDDIIPDPGLAGAHAAAYADTAVWAVTGQVLQPGEAPEPNAIPATERGLCASLDHDFRSTGRAWVRSVMAGNLSVRRARALQIGGFDENFVGVAYRFETEFSRRLWAAGGKVLYAPEASIRHLRAGRGGTRRYGSHLCSLSPAHGVGDYYFAWRHGLSLRSMLYMAARPFREVATRYHLAHPWCIPVKLLGEAAAAVWATCLALRGPRTMTPPAHQDDTP